MRWTPAISGSDKSITALAYGEGRFVAATDDGRILSSTDANYWVTADASPPNSLFAGLVHGDRRFVLVTAKGTVLSSTNGLDWQSRASGYNLPLTGVAYGAGTYVAVGGGSALCSQDSSAWTQHTATTNELRSVAYGNGLFVAVGPGTIVVSTDGQDWRSANPRQKRSFST